MPGRKTIHELTNTDTPEESYRYVGPRYRDLGLYYERFTITRGRDYFTTYTHGALRRQTFPKELFNDQPHESGEHAPPMYIYPAH
jgi:hypothetical protein